MPRTLTIKELSTALGISTKTLRGYAHADMPGDKDKRPAMFDPDEVRAWMATASKSGKPGRPANPISDKIKSADLRLKTAKAKLAEMDLEKRCGELISRADVDAANVRKVLAVKSGLANLAAALPSQLVGLTAGEIQTKIDAEAERLLTLFSTM